MYQPTTRVLTVLELLQSRVQISGRELAERLEVDERTVRRYITSLQDLGVPVEAIRGRYGAYHLRPGYKLPPLMFTEDEALSLTLGLLAVRQLGLGAAAPAVEGALAKVERVLPEALRQRVRAVQEAINITGFSGQSANQDTLIILSLAAQRGQQVHIAYTDHRGEQNERTINPYGVVYYTSYWYVVGYCHLREDLRVFRMDRVRQPTLLDAHFEPPANFDCYDYVGSSLATIPNTWTVTVRLDTYFVTARRLIAPSVALLEELPDGGVKMTATAGDLGWLARFLIALGLPFTVLDPPELRDELRKVAEAVLASL